MKSKILNLKNPTFEYHDETYSLIGIEQLWGIFPLEKGCINAIHGWKWVDERSFINTMFIEAFKENGRQVMFGGSPLICLQSEDALETIQAANFGDDEMKEYLVTYTQNYLEEVQAAMQRFNEENAE